MLTLIDLCCGTGGFSLAFEQTKKVKTILANDMVPESKLIFDLNFDCELTCCPLEDIESIPQADILTMGFSCQPFSIAGNRKGYEDDRTNVIFTCFKLIETQRPRCIVFENVKNLITHDSGKSLERILNMLNDLDYHVKYKLLNTCIETSIPQNRERVYIVAFQDEKACSRFQFPEKVDTLDNVSDYLDSSVDDKYYYDERFKIYDKIKDYPFQHIEISIPKRTYQRKQK